MENIISYIAEYGNYSFSERPFCPVDSLILSQLSYLNFDRTEKIPLKKRKAIPLSRYPDMKKYPKLFENIRASDSNQRMFLALSRSERFGSVKVFLPLNDNNPLEEKQFFAVTFIINKKLHYVSFRGTDSTFNGWKEDFNMSFKSVASQTKAALYLDLISSKLKGALIIGGHSKGGNLAVYASIFADEKIKSRIQGVFNHDGPGFLEEIYKMEEYNSIKSKIHKTVPESSLFGLLLKQQEDYVIVESNAKGIAQHDPFTWVVREGSFVPLPEISPSSKLMSEAINEWVERLDENKRKDFVDSLFQIISLSNPDSVSDFVNNWKEYALKVFSMKDVDKETRNFVLKTLFLFAKIYGKLSIKRILSRKKSDEKTSSPDEPPDNFSIENL